MLDCILASSSVYHHMRQGFPDVNFQLEPVKIQNISLKPNEKLDLQRFYKDHNISVRTSPICFQA